MPSSLRTALIVALAAGLAILALGGCGSDEGEPIPSDQSEELLRQLEQVREAFTIRDCVTARTHAIEFSARIDELPSDVVGYNELVEAGSNLNQLIASQCEDLLGSEQSTLEAPPETSSTSTTSSTTSTTTEEIPTTEEPEVTTEEPGNEGNGQDKDKDKENKGQGNSGGGIGGG